MRLRIGLALIALMAAACSPAVPGDTTETNSESTNGAGAATKLTVAGTPVTDGAAFLRTVEATSRNRERDGFRCYFSSFDDVELNPFVRCGPAHPNLRAEQGPWETFRIHADIDPSGTRLGLGRQTGTGYRLLDAETLSRPDGVAAPAPDEMSVPVVTGRVFETVWESLGYDFHYCMARHGVYVFDAQFLLDGRELREVDQGDTVEVVRLIAYDLATFGPEERARDLEGECLDVVARQAGASFGEIAE